MDPASEQPSWQPLFHDHLNREKLKKTKANIVLVLFFCIAPQFEFQAELS